MHLGDHRPPAILQALDHPQLPEWLAAIQGLREDPAGQVAQLVLAARRWNGGVADVIEDLEVGIVDPHRPPDATRGEPHLLAVSRHQRQLARDEPDQVAICRRRAFEDRHRSDVHRIAAVLDVEERRVLHAHHIHVKALQLAAPAGTCGRTPQAVDHHPSQPGLSDQRTTFDLPGLALQGTHNAAQGTAARRSSGIGRLQLTQRP